MRFLDGVTLVATLVAVFALVLGLLFFNLRVLVNALPLAACLVATSVIRRRAERGDGQLRIGADGTLELTTARGHIVVRKEDLAWGTARANRVEMETKSGRRLAFTTTSEEQAERVLEATDTGADKSTITLALRAAVGPAVAGFAFFVAAGFPAAEIAERLVEDVGARLAVMTLIALVISVALVKIFVSPELEIGVDGLRLKRVMRSRFIPITELAGVLHAAAGTQGEPQPYKQLVLVLASGERIEVPTVTLSEEDIERVVLRLEAVQRARSAPLLAAGAFARQGRSLKRWRDRLKGMIGGAGGFRERRVSVADAEATLSDPKAELEQRLGAALVLRELEPDAAAERVRIAVRAALDPETKRVLGSALDDDDAILAAMEELTVAEEREMARPGPVAPSRADRAR